MKRFLCLSTCLLICFFAFAPLNAEGAAKDRVLRVGWSQEPRTLNTMGYDTVQATMILRSMIYESLLCYDEGLNPSPMLATSWQISDDELVWTFEITDKAVWHDGKPLTSEDIAFTYRYILENEIPNFINYLKHIDSIETPDPQTLVLKYKEPIASTAYDLCNVFIVPRHKWEAIPGGEAVTYDDKTPLGSGPFIFEAWKKNDHMSFKANKDYWRRSPGVDRIVFTYFSSSDPMIMSLRKGDIDVIGSELTPLAARILKREKAVTVTEAPDLYYRHICINSSSFGNGHPALRDARVRRALTMAVDKQHLVDLIHLGNAQPAVSLVLPATPYFFNNDIEPYGFDLQRAAALLDEAGWKDTDGDGIRDKDGKPLNIRLLVISRWSEEMRAAEMIKGWWKEIGVGLTLQSADGGTILAELFPDYKHDMYLWGFSGQPDPNFNLLIYLSSQLRKWNGAGYENPEYDALYEKQARAVEREKRRELIHRIQEIHYRDCPSIVLYYMTSLGAYRSDRLTGFNRQMAGGIISHLNVDNFTGVRFK
jgi:peptide/nickel transport system substrate-binding protein